MNYLSLFVSNTKSKRKVDIQVCTVLMHAKLDLLCKVRLRLFSQRFSERFLVVLVQHWFTDWVKNTLDCCFYCLFYTTTTELCVKSLQSTELIHKPFVLFLFAFILLADNSFAMQLTLWRVAQDIFLISNWDSRNSHFIVK